MAGRVFMRLGHTTAERAVRFALGGKTVLEAELGDIERAFKPPIA